MTYLQDGVILRNGLSTGVRLAMRVYTAHPY